MKSSKVSIILPIYNVDKYLSKCLDSILAQTYRDLEIILIDDGSTDDSAKICDEYAKHDKRIVVKHQKNGGVSAARNAGLELATSEFITFIDPDDYVDENHIETLVEVQKRDNSDVVICAYNDIRLQNDLVFGTEALRRLLVLQRDLDILIWNKLYRASLFKNNKIIYPVGRIHEDNLTTYKVLYFADKVTYIDANSYHYISRKGSITKANKLLIQLNERRNAAIEAIDFLKEDDSAIDFAYVSKILAEFRFIDCSIGGLIDKKFFKEYRREAFETEALLSSKKCLTSKLKLYFALLRPFGGLPYKLFRKIKK